jgi:agmatine deiminase
VKKASKYRMPAEWEPHEATWLAWPHNQDHWPDKFEPIPLVYAEIIRILAAGEAVYICVNDEEMEQQALETLRQAKLHEALLNSIRFFRIPTNASWSRDHAPIFVRDASKSLVITDWVFNAWGNKYKPYDLDNLVPQKVAKALNIPSVQPGIVLEGGSIDVNGKGTLLTTEQCLLNENRNPHLNREQIEGYLRDYLGITKVLWLKEGIVGDDTDGHIDDIARFVNETTIVTVVEDDPQDENYALLQENLSLLKEMTDQDNKPFTIIELPMPDPVVFQDQRLPASYANFYIANQAVLVPTFRCKQDQKALDILQRLFPNRQVVGVDCVDLVWGLGTIHCSTQQQPVKA